MKCPACSYDNKSEDEKFCGMCHAPLVRATPDAPASAPPSDGGATPASAPAAAQPASDAPTKAPAAARPAWVKIERERLPEPEFPWMLAVIVVLVLAALGAVPIVKHRQAVAAAAEKAAAAAAEKAKLEKQAQDDAAARVKATEAAAAAESRFQAQIEAAAAGAAKFVEKPFTQAHLGGKVLVLDKDTKAADRLQEVLPAGMVARAGDPVSTVVWLEHGYQRVGQYGTTKIEARVALVTVTVVDLEHSVRYKTQLKGGPPPKKEGDPGQEGDGYRIGTPPDHEVVQCLVDLARK